MMYAEPPVAVFTRKNFTCRVIEGPICAKPGVHHGQCPYYISCNGHAALGAIWDEQLALAAAKGLAKRKARKCGIHQGSRGLVM